MQTSFFGVAAQKLALYRKGTNQQLVDVNEMAANSPIDSSAACSGPAMVDPDKIGELLDAARKASVTDFEVVLVEVKITTLRIIDHISQG